MALSHLRHHRRLVVRDRGLIERLPPPRNALPPSDPMVSWRDIRRALDRLSGDDRELVLLIAWDGLSGADAAAVLGATPGAARTGLHRARSRLAALLEDESRCAADP